LPHLQKLYADLKEKGLEIIAVNYGDSAETVARYFRTSGFTFRAALGARGADVFNRYSVQAYPANYLLDGDGRIVWRAVGYDATTLEQLKKALEELGVK
jgi:hypothetical protein